MVTIADEASSEELSKARTRAQEAAELQAVADSFEPATGEDEDEEESSDEEEVEFVAGPTVWEAAADEEIPENHWDYHMRKNMNDGRGDSVARNLSYVPVCNCMPVCSGEDGCRNPYFMWTKKK